MNKKAFTLAEIMIVVAIIALIAAIAIPNFMKNRLMAQSKGCIANLRVMDTVKMLWAADTDANSDSVPTWSDLVSDYIKKTPSCPAGGTYTLGSVGSDTACTEISGTYPHRLQ